MKQHIGLEPLLEAGRLSMVHGGKCKDASKDNKDGKDGKDDIAAWIPILPFDEDEGEEARELL
jgi:hypothetical protein